MTLRQFCFYIQANWIKTICLNFRLLKFGQAIHLPILLFGKCDFVCGKDAKAVFLNGGGKFASVIVGNNDSYVMGLNNSRPERTYLSIEGNIVFDGVKQFIGNGTKIHVGKNATLKLGERFFCTGLCKIICHNCIEIGAMTRFSWEVQAMDTNFHYMTDEEGCVKRRNGSIFIGKNCWIGNRCTVQKGTYLNDYSIVASNSVVNKNFSHIEKGTFGGVPAKFIKSGYNRLLNFALEYALDDYFANNPEINEVKVDKEESYKYWSKDNLEIKQIEK